MTEEKKIDWNQIVETLNCKDFTDISLKVLEEGTFKDYEKEDTKEEVRTYKFKCQRLDVKGKPTVYYKTSAKTLLFGLKKHLPLIGKAFKITKPEGSYARYTVIEIK